MFTIKYGHKCVNIQRKKEKLGLEVWHINQELATLEPRQQQKNTKLTLFFNYIIVMRYMYYTYKNDTYKEYMLKVR